MIEGPLAVYRARANGEALEYDPMQALAAEKLQSLHNALSRYQPSAGGAGWKERLGLGRRAVSPPQGLYIFGPVGTGKSMLMDIFFAAAPVAAKRRVHFHEFMLEVHERLHTWRARHKDGTDAPLPSLAAELATEACLLCFDELQVRNIADAMILGRLFQSLFDAGVVVVATSNAEPDRLYEGGLQRENFLPFIEVLKTRLDLLELDSGLDYRLRHLRNLPVYHAPLDDAAGAAIEATFAQLTAGAVAQPMTLPFKGRSLAVPRAARGVARFTFAELCGAPLGAADYLELARRFHTLVLSGVPRMGPDQRNEARRFITLVDALYEQRVNLVLSADGPPEALYREGTGAQDFARTVSRLHEMQSSEYIAAVHAA